MPTDVSRFRALLATGQRLLEAGGNTEAVLRVIVDESLAAIPHAAGAIILFREGEDLIYRAASGQAGRHVGSRKPIDHDLAGYCMRAKRPLLCTDVEEKQDIDLHFYRSVGVRALISVPLIVRDVSIGVLKFYSPRPGAFVQKDLVIAQLVANTLLAGLVAMDDGYESPAGEAMTGEAFAMMDSLPQAIWTMSPKGELRYRNNWATGLAGTGSQNALALISPEDRAFVLRQCAMAASHRNPGWFECHLHRPDGASVWVLVHLVPEFDAALQVQEWVGTAVDISRFKEREQALQREIGHKGLLLSEVNHRVKNSIQVATGLLTLQAEKVRDRKDRERLMEVRNQLATIAQVHQAAERASDDGRIEFVQLVRNLSRSLAGEGRSRRARIVEEGDEELFVPLGQGMTLALIICELVTNAIKHVVPVRRNPVIVTGLHRDKDFIRLEISDNGPGLPADFDPYRSGGLGMEIIHGLAEQAGGSIEIGRGASGGRFTVIVPRDEPSR